jgi:hypothetical protein
MADRAFRSGQVSIEFLIMSSFILLVFLLIGGVAAERAGVLSVQRVAASYAEYTSLVQLEIALAQRAAPGYIRTFDCLPGQIAGRDYTVELRKGPGGGTLSLVSNDPKLAPLSIKVPATFALAQGTPPESVIRRIDDAITLELCVRSTRPVTATELVKAQCENGVDDDGDGAADAGADPGCSLPADESERCLEPTGCPVCDNGQDNDGDQLADSPSDPGCAGPSDGDERSTFACDNGIDDDGDSFVDVQDTGCDSPVDTSERCVAGASDCASCDDGQDNEQDGFVDNTDPGCDNPADGDETHVLCGACTACGPGLGFAFCSRAMCGQCSRQVASHCYFDSTVGDFSGSCTACAAGTTCASYGNDAFTCNTDPCLLADRCAFIGTACCADNDNDGVCG